MDPTATMRYRGVFDVFLHEKTNSVLKGNVQEFINLWRPFLDQLYVEMFSGMKASEKGHSAVTNDGLMTGLKDFLIKDIWGVAGPFWTVLCCVVVAVLMYVDMGSVDIIKINKTKKKCRSNRINSMYNMSF